MFGAKRIELFLRILQLEAGAVQEPKCRLDVADVLWREPPPLEPLGIDAVRLRGAAHRHHVGRDIAGDRRIVGDESMRADLAELMYARETAHVHPVTHLDVATERR